MLSWEFGGKENGGITIVRPAEGSFTSAVKSIVLSITIFKKELSLFNIYGKFPS